jgi:hypothetical protein
MLMRMDLINKAQELGLLMILMFFFFLLGSSFQAIQDVSGYLFLAGSSLYGLFYTPSFMECTTLALDILNGLSLTSFSILYQELSLRDAQLNLMLYISSSANASITISLLNKLHKISSYQQREQHKAQMLWSTSVQWQI